MSTIGYYNYYNDPHRYKTDVIIDRYQQMVDRYNSDELHSSNYNPYSEENIAIRALDEKLAPMAEAVRSQCKTKEEVRQYLCQKYFGVPEVGYTKRWEEPEKYAMMENDYNAVCFGTVGGCNRQDPRLHFSQKTWDEYEAEQNKFKHDAISNQMSNLLKNNGITLGENEQLFISVNPYDFSSKVQGDANLQVLSEITNLLGKGRNSQELLYYMMQTTGNLDADAVTKFRAYQQVKKFTNEDLSKMQLKDGEFYTSDGQKLTDILLQAIDKDKSIGLEFKGVAFEHLKEQLDVVAQKGWNSMPDLKLSIGYNSKDGFYSFGQTYEG